MEATLHVVDEERKRVKAEFLEVQAKLGLLKGNTPRILERRAELKIKQSEIQARLTSLKAQSRALRGLPERPPLPATADEAAAIALTAALDEVKALRERVLQLKHDLHIAHSRVEDVETIRERCESRVAAGQERRREMVLTLNALIRCEDDETLPEDEYERRMDAVVRKARTLVSLEKLALTRGEGA